MKIGAFGRGVLIALAYCAVFMALVVVQFPSSGPEVVSSGAVTLRVQRGGQEDAPIRSVELSAAGLRLVLSERVPLNYRDQADSQRSCVPVSFVSLAEGIKLSFNDGSSLAVVVDAGGKASWTLVTSKPAISVSLPFLTARGAKLLNPAPDGSPRLEADGRSYVVSGVASGTVGELTLIVTRGAVAPVVVTPEAGVKQAADIRFLAQTPMEPEAWRVLLTDWQDTAWAYLSGPRFDADAATWAGTDGRGDFSETSFVAYMSEALRRGRFDQAAGLVTAVRSRYIDRITWLSVPFAGRTTGAMSEFEAEGLAAAKAAERKLQSKSPSLFFESDIIHLLFDRSPYSLAQEAMAFAGSLDFSTAELLNAVRLLKNYLDTRAYLADEKNPFGKTIELADRVVAPAVRRAESGFYLVTGPDGYSDTFAGLDTGMTLVRLGEATGKTIYTGIGHSLIKAILAAAAADGSVPRSFTVRDGAAIPSGTRLAAQDIYGMVAISPYYPRAVTFFRELGPGAWAWTCSPSLELKATSESITYSANYPAGSSHYLTVYGVKQFSRIQIYGLNYNMDAGFETYNASGYLYKRASGALYLKMRHRTRTEEVQLIL